MPLGAWIRHELALLLPRRLAVWLAIRRLTPYGCRWPRASVEVLQADTGGAWRAELRMQDPAVDPREPNGGESSSAGSDHGWSNCTMASGATAIAYQQPRTLAPWGGDLRHRQGDMSGGTDLYDLRTAWAAYGEELTIRSGSGWSEVAEAHGQGRAIVAQGEGNVPGSQSFDGGHACVIGPESRTSDGAWLFGDPLASGWQWVKPGEIRAWMERWQSSCAFAVGEKPPPPPPDPAPTPPPPAPIDRYPEGYGDGRDAGLLQGRAEEADRTFASWLPGREFEPPEELEGGRWGLAAWAGSEPVQGDPWAAWPIPIAAVYAAQHPAVWSGSSSGWTAAVWRG